MFLFYQGALIASSLVLIQETEHSCPKVAKFREIYAKVISDKHEDIIAKFGATLAQGILDAGEYLHLKCVLLVHGSYNDLEKSLNFENCLEMSLNLARILEKSLNC